MSHVGIKLFFCLFLIIGFTQCFLQFRMIRLPESGSFINRDKVQCITPDIDKKMTEQQNKDRDSDDDDEEVDEDQNYKEICYEKDISYSIALYYNDEVKYMSMDLTTPISWLKGQKCHIEGSSKKCTSIQSNFKDTLSGISHGLAKHFSKHKKSNTKLAMIEGSSELIKGIQQKSEHLKFYTRDAGRLSRFTEMIMMGFWMRGEKDLLQIESTLFINATEISANLNTLCDGAISLRFDDMSENSFLKEVFDYVKKSEQVITVYLSPTGSNVLTIGDLTTKNTELGYGGINWMKVDSDENYGKIPTATDIIIEDEDSQVFTEFNDLEMPVVITMSASYIGLPQKLMSPFKKQYQSDRQCKVNEETRYFECNKIKKGDLDKAITFSFDNTKVTFLASELVLEKHHKKVIFNIKSTFHEEYAILGEPLFKKYFVALDYGKNRIGVGPLKGYEFRQTYGMVKVIRYTSFLILTIGLVFLCFSPLRKVFEKIKVRGQQLIEKGKEYKNGERTYAPVQDNPYNQFGSRISSTFGDDQAEGI